MKPSPQHLKKTSRSEARSAPVRLSAMFGCSVLLFGLSLTTVGFLAPTAASADPTSCTAPTGTGLQKNINTTQGCDVIDGTSLMTGYIADTGLSAGQKLTLTDGYEGLSSHNFYFGTYVLDLACSTGSVSSAESTYVVEEGTGSYPNTPPTITSGTLPVVTADASGKFVCTWALSVENAPSGQLNSSRNDLWGSDGSQTATTSVKPPVITSPPPPTTVPTTVPETTTVPTTVPETTTVPTTVPETTTVPTTVPETTTVPTTVPETTTVPTTVPETTTTITPTSSTSPVESTTTTAPASTTTTPGSSTTIAPASTSAPAATTAAPADGTTHALAFTGSDTRGLVIGGFVLMSLGGLIVRASRRGQRSNG